jgi:hypothetical protein
MATNVKMGEEVYVIVIVEHSLLQCGDVEDNYNGQV